MKSDTKQVTNVSYTVSSTGIASSGVSGATPRMVGTNPFNSVIAFTGQPGTIFTVFDSAGRVVHSSIAEESGLMEWMPDLAITNGVYFTQFIYNGSVSTARAVLLR